MNVGATGIQKMQIPTQKISMNKTMQFIPPKDGTSHQTN
jgi:hypothetical protein